MRWRSMAWSMMPSLAAAMAACTWHFYYNAPQLEVLVVVQGAMTVVSCWVWLVADTGV